MDSKKQNLTPELKEIYERVMNTQVKPSGAAPTQATPPPAVPQPPTPAPSAPPAAAPMQATPAAADPSKPFLSSLPPRPVAPEKPFVFTAGGKKPAEAAPAGPKIDHAKAAPVNKPGSKVSLPVMVAGGATFLVVYVIFWLKLFSFF